ncbi:MAG TPA: tetratricopeptide repeat protein [Pseudolabrys sp.]|nr:tetratricopeptide repeat protein [Pseudolabrys sp.]
MLIGIARGFIIAGTGLWLAGCSTSVDFSDLLKSKTDASAPQETANASVPAADEEPTGTTSLTGATSLPWLTSKQPTVPVASAKPGLLGSDPNDELSLGKKHYRANDFGLAEKHFRRAVETHPRDAEAWLGLAASYDRLRRFDLADRAYAQAISIVGPTVVILNNQGYSYMLRGDYKRAHAALLVAQRKDPTNKYVQNNLRLLEESYRRGKTVE